MYEHEILRNEEAYVAKLTERERLVYSFDAALHAKLVARFDYYANNFVSKALLLNSLHKQHATYNALMEKYVYNANPTDTIDIENVLSESMRMTISIGGHAAVIDLEIMDDCDEVYRLLAVIKMNAFDWLRDDFDIDSLFDE